MFEADVCNQILVGIGIRFESSSRVLFNRLRSAALSFVLGLVFGLVLLLIFAVVLFSNSAIFLKAANFLRKVIEMLLNVAETLLNLNDFFCVGNFTECSMLPESDEFDRNRANCKQRPGRSPLPGTAIFPQFVALLSFFCFG